MRNVLYMIMWDLIPPAKRNHPQSLLSYMMTETRKHMKKLKLFNIILTLIPIFRGLVSETKTHG